ncbi:MAG TPA: DsbA family protein [Conexibacter sp.]|jgi:2-hydroxychromene-2-carboxylate isomerase
MTPARLFLDVGSPYAYLAAERADALLPGAVWEPVLLGGVFRANGRSSWARTPAREEGMREIERRAAAYGLPPVVWPEPWPGDMLTAMRAATAAKALGAERAFLLAALRLGFREGRDMSDRDAVLDAARLAGLDADAINTAVDDPFVKALLRAATDEAHALGVFGVPTALVGDQLFWGDDRLEDAAAAAGSAPAGGAGAGA